MKTITGNISAYLSAYSVEVKDSPDNFKNLSFSSVDMTPHGWVKVGDAEVSVSLFDSGEITRSQVAVLQEAKRRVQAESQAKINQIEGQIQSLLAIEYKS